MKEYIPNEEFIINNGFTKINHLVYIYTIDEYRYLYCNLNTPSPHIVIAQYVDEQYISGSIFAKSREELSIIINLITL